MSNVFPLPDVGEGLTEADIVAWKVAEGDTVTVNQILVEIETAKSLVELPSPQAGTIEALLVGEGETVDVGTPIVRFGGEGSDGSERAGTTPVEEPGAPAPDQTDAVPAPTETGDGTAGPNLVGYGVRAASSKRRPRKQAGSPQAAAQPAPEAPASRAAPAADTETAPSAAPAEAQPRTDGPADPGSSTGRVLAKPPVRKLAKDRGIDLAGVRATGSRGEVTRADLLAHLDGGSEQETPAGASTPAGSAGASAAAGAAAAAAQPGSEERVPLKGVNRMMAKAMVDSAFTAPHVTEFLDVDVTRTMEFVRHLKSTQLLGPDVKVSPLLVVARAVIWAALRTPRINAVLDGDDVVIKHYVNLGIAAATPRGLVVPNIKNAHALGLGALAQEIVGLTAAARAGRSTPASQAGGTITITNVGVFGVDSGTPIINPGESAIVAFGSIRKRPWVVDDEIVPREITTLSVSADHRVVDGAAISQFLADIGRALEEPLVMLS